MDDAKIAYHRHKLIERLTPVVRDHFDKTAECREATIQALAAMLGTVFNRAHNLGCDHNQAAEAASAALEGLEIWLAEVRAERN